MLSRVIIKKLFGTYSYDLHFECEADSCITILFGPNGYGKTTILNLINALYHRDYKTFAVTPFEKLVFYLDGMVFRVIRRCNDTADVEDDIPDTFDVEMELNFGNDNGMDLDERVVLKLKQNKLVGKHPKNFELFMTTRTSRYVKDSRMIIKKTGRKVVKKYESGEIVDVLAKDLAERLRKVNVADADIKGLPGELGDNIRLFDELIRCSFFPNKKMVVDNNFGFRFKHSNNLFLLPSQLSSGEKHILIQCYELIFNAPNDSLALVDEPELSFHPVWASQYVENIKRIQKAKGGQNKVFQMVLATHSPLLIGQRWSITRDLYSLSKN